MSAGSGNNSEDFARLLTANHSRIRAFIYTLVHDHHSADDVMQEVASVLWKKYSEGEEVRDFGAWAITVARFTVLNWRRRQARVPIPMDDEQFAILADAAVEAVVRNDPRGDALMDCIQQLDATQHALIEKRYVKGFSAQQIGDQEGRSRIAVHKSLTKIRELLVACTQRKIAEGAV